MDKSEARQSVVGRGRTWQRRLSTLIRKHPRPPRAPSPPRASSAPPSRITSHITPVPSSSGPPPAPLRPATTTDSTATTTPDRYVAYEADWSTMTPSTDYEETSRSTAVTSVEEPVEAMRVLEQAFRPVEQRPLMVDLEDGMEGGLRKACAFLVEVAQGTGVIGSGARVSLRALVLASLYKGGGGVVSDAYVELSSEAQHTGLLEARGTG